MSLALQACVSEGKWVKCSTDFVVLKRNQNVNGAFYTDVSNDWGICWCMMICFVLSFSSTLKRLLHTDKAWALDWILTCLKNVGVGHIVLHCKVQHCNILSFVFSHVLILWYKKAQSSLKQVYFFLNYEINVINIIFSWSPEGIA